MKGPNQTVFLSDIPFISVIKNWVGFTWSWVFLICLSLAVMAFQVYNVDIFETVKRYNDIRNNMGNWTSNIIQMEELEKNKNSNVVFSTRGEIKNWQCFDGGSYYIPVRLGKSNLPESIRRGVGGAWKIKKGAGYDEAALQFCNYIIDERSDELITCGLDAFNKTGNSGMFDSLHWCKSDWSRLVHELSM
ncbi:viral late protein H2 [Salmon gill poxvirus]|uniref:Viral late protein H2 n=1 Tax=Salmon gill poxvirus TaxID=1680908 RepID=A0A0H4Y1J7_9POXV|nr:viral late protein H2 [Salmon gill poxvirus]AKR04292.1 viral late protein H2 [Salmon gill poxvirus]